MGIRTPMTAGLVIVAVFVGGFGTWAAVAPLESAAIAPGIIGVSTERRTVQHLEGASSSRSWWPTATGWTPGRR